MASVEQTVLEIAKEGGYFEGDIPVDEEELVAQAEYFSAEAEAAWDSGMRDPYVGRILVARSFMTQEDFEAAMAEGEIIDGPADVQSDDEQRSEPKYSSGPVPRSSGGYSESDLREPSSAVEAETEAEAFMRESRLPIPRSVTQDQPDLPFDFTELDDRVLRRYHSLYGSFLAKARWLLSVTLSDLANATHMRDEAFRVSLLKVDRIDKITEKAKSVAALDAEAKDSPEYQDWAERVNKHNKDAAIRKGVVDIYQSNVDRLSREWTMRTEEFERSK